MSKKLPPSRLENLFANLDHNEISSDSFEENHAARPNWTWEADSQGTYLSCGPEVLDGLGVSPIEWVGRSLFTYRLSDHSQKQLLSVLHQGHFPAEFDGEYRDHSERAVQVRMTIFLRHEDNGNQNGWRGFNQVISIPSLGPQPVPELLPTNGKKPVQKKSTGPLNMPELVKGISLQDGKTQKAERFWTNAAQTSLELKKSVTEVNQEMMAAALAVPFKIGDDTDGVIEILDENKQRKWSEDDLLLAQDIARQLAQAIENARLYAAVQRELTDRIRAEKETVRRNQELRLLNQVGQQLSKLTSRQELLNLVQKSIGEIVDHRNLTIAIYDPLNNTLSFPVHTVNHARVILANRPIRNLIVDQIILRKAPLLLGNEVKQGLQQWDIDISEPLPKSLLGIPMLAGDRPVGVILVEDFENENTYTSVDVELLSTIAAQATTALENSNLFKEITNALQTLEIRERYQGNVARAVAILTQFGTQALPEVLNILSSAAKNDRTFFAAVEQAENYPIWRTTSEWPKPTEGKSGQSITPELLNILSFPHWLADLRENGWFAGIASEIPAPERGYFQSHGISSILLLAVPGNGPIPHFLAFEQYGDQRKWLSEEINILRLAADAFSNTLIREDLLGQLQVSLDETELLYQVNKGIAQANDPEALINLVASQMLPEASDQTALFNILKTSDGGISGFEIVGFFDKNHGPSCLGMVIPATNLPHFLHLSDPEIIPDILESTMDAASQETLHGLGMLALSIIPLRSGERDIGYLTVSSQKSTQFKSDEIHVLQVAAGSFAVALERYRLLTESQRRALELQTAAEIARDTTSTLDIDRLLERIVNLLKDRFNFYHVSIFLLDEPGKFAVIRESSGEAGRLMKERGHKLAVGSRSVIGMVTATGKIEALTDISQSTAYYPNPLLPETRAEIGIPLKSGDRVFGALDIQYNRTHAFTNSDVSVLQILADQIVVAIQNANAYELSQTAYQEIKEVDRVKSQFLANMSHELRTPLNSIIGFSRVILKGIDGPVNEVQKQDLTAIYSSGQHLLTLINNILDLSKIEAGKMELQIAELNVSDTINGVMSTAVGLVKDKPIRLSHELPPDLPTVQADQTRVRQILLNFVSNAAKFTEKGTITVTAAQVTSPIGKQEVMITITDTGAGIAPEDQEKLFQPFSQVDGSPTRKTGGTGLGLSICRSMVEMHGGRIGLLRSENGKGSTFYFTLPATLPERTAEPAQPKDKLILAIDDDLQVLNLYQRYLRPQGYQVIPLTDPKQAVAQAASLKPYAITLDIMLPEIDGWQVLQKLKNDPETVNIPVIICSILEEEEKGYNLGAADYLVKPFLPEELINTVNHISLSTRT